MHLPRRISVIGMLSVCYFCSTQIAQAQTQLSLSTGTMQYLAREYSSSGAVINQDSGRIPFLRFGIEQSWAERYFVSASLKHGESTIQYSGFTQIGIPISTKAQLGWHQSEVLAGLRHEYSDSQKLKLAIGVGQLRIDRNILPTLGSLPLREILNTTHVIFEGVWEQSFLPSSSWHAGFKLRSDVKQRLFVDSFGQFDPVTLSPKKGVDSALYIGVKHALSLNSFLQAQLNVDSFSPGGSETALWRKGGVPVATVRYPGSNQRAISIDLRFSRRF